MPRVVCEYVLMVVASVVVFSNYCLGVSGQFKQRFNKIVVFFMQVILCFWFVYLLFVFVCL